MTASNPPFVSVIVPAYNASDTIRQCLEALLAQDYARGRYEIIIVNNNSVDATQDIVSQHDVTLLHEIDRQSSYAARNKGIRHARGEILAFTDADCVPEPNWITQLALAFSRPSVVGAGGRVLDAEPLNDVQRFVTAVRPLRNAQRLDDTHYVSVITANAAYRRQTLDALGGFDDRMVTGGDIDLSWRIQRHGLGEIVYVPQAVVSHQHRRTPQGMHRQFRRYGYCSAMMTALHRTDRDYPQTTAWQRQQVVRQLVALITYLASLCYRNTVGLIEGRSAYERKKPVYWLLAESGALSGRLRGMWETRLFSRLPRAFREPRR